MGKSSRQTVGVIALMTIIAYGVTKPLECAIFRQYPTLNESVNNATEHK